MKSPPLRALLLVAVFLLPGPGHAEAGKVYKWTDAAGHIHFSDRPVDPANAEEIRIRTFSGSAEVAPESENGSEARAVKIFTTTWCGVCRRAKAYLTSKGISFSEYDVETSEIGRQEYKRLAGKGVPIILVGNQKMNGFSASKLDAMLKNAGYP